VSFPLIEKDSARFRPAPNLVDYVAARTEFEWAKARALLDGLPEDRGLNIAHEAVDRHLRGPGAVNRASAANLRIGIWRPRPTALLMC
jgi:hypothetical protein